MATMTNHWKECVHNATGCILYGLLWGIISIHVLFLGYQYGMLACIIIMTFYLFEAMRWAFWESLKEKKDE